MVPYKSIRLSMKSNPPQLQTPDKAVPSKLPVTYKIQFLHRELIMMCIKLSVVSLCKSDYIQVSKVFFELQGKQVRDLRAHYGVNAQNNIITITHKPI